MFLWTELSRAWSLKAARASTYHEEQARACLPLLEDVQTVADLGCGLGFLAMELAKLGKTVMGVDTDETCLFMAVQEAERRGIANVDYLLADAFALCGELSWDAVVTCHFGDMVQDFEKFYLLANKVVLAFVERADDTPLIPGLERRRKRNAEDVASGLEAMDCNFARVDCDFEFGQPFDDMEEARAFVTHYSKGLLAGKELDAFLEERLVERPVERFGERPIAGDQAAGDQAAQDRGTGLYLPHTKRMTLFSVRIGTSYWDFGTSYWDSPF